jgi:hypothetical protein
MFEGPQGQNNLETQMRLRKNALAISLVASLFVAAAVFAAQPSATVNACAAIVPNQPVKGAVMGKPFVAGTATIYDVKPWLGHYAGWYLTFQNNVGDDMLQVQVLTRMKELPDGKTFRRLPVSDPSRQPSVGEDAMEVQSWYLQIHGQRIDTGFTRDEATLTVSFGARKDGVLPGKLALCIPAQRAVVTGSFTAKITL